MSLSLIFVFIRFICKRVLHTIQQCTHIEERGEGSRLKTINVVTFKYSIFFFSLSFSCASVRPLRFDPLGSREKFHETRKEEMKFFFSTPPLPF